MLSSEKSSLLSYVSYIYADELLQIKFLQLFGITYFLQLIYTVMLFRPDLNHNNSLESYFHHVVVIRRQLFNSASIKNKRTYRPIIMSTVRGLFLHCRICADADEACKRQAYYDAHIVLTTIRVISVHSARSQLRHSQGYTAEAEHKMNL